MGTSRAGAGSWWGSRRGGRELISSAHPHPLLDAVPEISLSFQTLFLPGISRFNLSALPCLGGLGPLPGLGVFKQPPAPRGETAKEIPCTEDACVNKLGSFTSKLTSWGLVCLDGSHPAGGPGRGILQLPSGVCGGLGG